MDVGSAIRRAVPVLVQYGTIDEDIRRAWLIRNGLSRAEAEMAVRFIPLAFAREILAGTGVMLSDTYIRLRADGTQEERALRDEQFFTASAYLASIILKEIGGDAFTAIVCLSSEFDAVNQALNAGSSPHHLIASPPVITWTDALESWKPRPWWKFWA
jgi:hypothetical protein